MAPGVVGTRARRRVHAARQPTGLVGYSVGGMASEWPGGDEAAPEDGGEDGGENRHAAKDMEGVAMPMQRAGTDAASPAMPRHLRTTEYPVLTPNQITADVENVFDSFRDIHQPPDRAAVLYKWLRPAYDNVQLQLRSVQSELAQSQLENTRLTNALQAAQLAQKRAEAESARLTKALEVAERERADAAARWVQARDAATSFKQRAAEAEERRQLAARAAKALQAKLNKANLELEATALPREEANVAEAKLKQVQTDADALVHHATAEAEELRRAIAAAESDAAAARLALEREASARISAERHAALLAKEKTRLLNTSLKDKDRLANAAQSLSSGDTLAAERLLLPASQSAVFAPTPAATASKRTTYVTPAPYGNPGSGAIRPPRAEASAPTVMRSETSMPAMDSSSVLDGVGVSTSAVTGRRGSVGLRSERVAVALAAGSTPGRSLLPWNKAGQARKKKPRATRRAAASLSPNENEDAELAGVPPDVWRKVLGFVPEAARAAPPPRVSPDAAIAADDANFRAILDELGPEASAGFPGLDADAPALAEEGAAAPPGPFQPGVWEASPAAAVRDAGSLPTNHPLARTRPPAHRVERAQPAWS